MIISDRVGPSPFNRTVGIPGLNFFPDQEALPSRTIFHSHASGPDSGSGGSSRPTGFPRRVTVNRSPASSLRRYLGRLFLSSRTLTSVIVYTSCHRGVYNTGLIKGELECDESLE
jgi:hypothetical protein